MTAPTDRAADALKLTDWIDEGYMPLGTAALLRGLAAGVEAQAKVIDSMREIIADACDPVARAELAELRTLLLRALTCLSDHAGNLVADIGWALAQPQRAPVPAGDSP